MEKQLVYCIFVLLLIQTCHVQAQRSVLDDSVSEPNVKSNLTSSLDNGSWSVIQNADALTSTQPNPETLEHSSLDDTFETLFTGLYIAVLGMMAARAIFQIIYKASTLAKVCRVKKLLPPKLKSVDIEMGVKSELVGDGACNCKPILYSLEVTQNFSPVSHIGGSVYRGTINGREVVVKKMNGDVSHELKSLQKVEHENLVKLQGFCMASGGQNYLIYEYVENGSLDLWLHKASGVLKVGFSVLSWRTRLQIALDVATGLDHIHEKIGIVHRDLKSSNVFLNRNLRAKIANFGAAKYWMNPATKHKEDTEGYRAPEYSAADLVSPKIDVFAFGIVLLELIRGKQVTVKVGTVNLLWPQIRSLVEGHDREEKLRKWIDPNVQDTCSIDSVMSLTLIAKSCLEETVEARPTMEEVVYKLSNLLDVCFEHLECP
ncbi:hypothetical protein SUGI_0012690 [Cryptomeria japonica]|uniref:serine/threonine receptor-like kinase NFP n=1 Tax=Cryptomeria japonica TaxID=3369 RepID=UPI002408E2B9|nr:serine/threonine receptor-like kinase NFP [Cryptomeria japonica]GLJ05172.1 hypothetical protein SUGI_0012690 [Cryptomeria japonica]